MWKCNKFKILLLSLFAHSACHRFSNQFDEFRLMCGDLKSTQSQTLFLKAEFNGEEQEPKSLEIYRISLDGLRSQSNISFSTKGCIAIEAPARDEVLVLNKPSSENPLGARIDISKLDVENYNSVISVALEPYTNRGFDVWSQCGQLSEGLQQGLVFKVINNVTRDLDLARLHVYQSRGGEQKEIALNPYGCFEVQKNVESRLLLKDEVGLTYTEMNLTQEMSVGSLYPIYLRKAPSTEEVCTQRGIDWKWENQNCSLKSFVELCNDNNEDTDINFAIDLLKEGLQERSCSMLSENLLRSKQLGTLERKGIKDIRAIQSFSHFETLKLNQNRIRSISPLKDMSSLKELYLQNNVITSLEGLPQRAKLRILALWNNDIKDIDLLDQYKELEELYLQNNQINSISGLSELKKLRLLYLSDNSIQDLAPLKSLPKIEELYIAYNRIRSLEALSSLRSLKKLTLSFNQITDVSPLKDLNGIEVLYLWGNRIEDLSAISGWNKLQTLYISDNRVKSLHFLTDISSLDLFYAPDNKIDDISLLARQSRMRYLNLNNNPIKDLSPLKDLEYLIELKVAGTLIDQAERVEAATCPTDAKAAVVRDYCMKKVTTNGN